MVNEASGLDQVVPCDAKLDGWKMQPSNDNFTSKRPTPLLLSEEALHHHPHHPDDLQIPLSPSALLGYPMSPNQFSPSGFPFSPSAASTTSSKAGDYADYESSLSQTPLLRPRYDETFSWNNAAAIDMPEMTLPSALKPHIFPTGGTKSPAMTDMTIGMRAEQRRSDLESHASTINPWTNAPTTKLGSNSSMSSSFARVAQEEKRKLEATGFSHGGAGVKRQRIEQSPMEEQPAPYGSFPRFAHLSPIHSLTSGMTPSGNMKFEHQYPPMYSPHDTRFFMHPTMPGSRRPSYLGLQSMGDSTTQQQVASILSMSNSLASPNHPLRATQQPSATPVASARALGEESQEKVKRKKKRTVLDDILAAGATKSAGKRWTAAQDMQLRTAVQKYNGSNWKAIAEMVEGRTHVQCLQRWKKVLQPGLIKGMWSAEEDQLLLDLMTKIGKEKSWTKIAEFVPGRTAKQCRERWYLNLDPSINRDPWTEAEDKMLLEMHKKLGNKWAEIKRHLPGRTENGVKSRFKSIQRAIRKPRGTSSTSE